MDIRPIQKQSHTKIDEILAGINLSGKTRFVIVIGSAIAYLLLFVTLAPIIGKAITILSLMPIVVASWYFGIRGALVAFITVVPINVMLLSYALRISWVDLMQGGLGYAAIGTLLIGLIIGHSSAIRKRLYFIQNNLEQHVADRTQALLETNQTLQQEIATRKQTEADSQMRERYFRLLSNLTTTALETAHFQTMLQTVTDQTAGLLGADDCCLTFWDEATQTTIPIASSGPLKEIYPTLQTTPGEVTITASVIKTNRPLAMTDSRNSPYVSQRISSLFPTKSILALPLQANEKHIGALLFTYEKTHHFTEQEIRYGEQAARQIALAISKVQLYETSKKQAEQIQALYQVSLDISVLRNIHLVLQRIIEHATHLFKVDDSAVLLFNPKTQQLEWANAIGFDAVDHTHTFSMGEGISGQVYATRKPVLVNNYAQWEHRSEQWADVSGSAVGVPIQWGDTFFGTLNIGHASLNYFNEEDVKQLSQFAAQAAIAIQNAKLYQATQQQARQLAHILHSVQEGIIVLDADGFIKLVNSAAKAYLKHLSEVQPAKPLTALGGKPLNTLLAIESQLPIELIVTAPDNINRIFELTPHPIMVGEGIEGWVLMLHEATHDRHIQNRIQEQDRLVAVGQLAAGIAHDFNNILTSIIGFADLLQRKTEPDSVSQNALNLIVQQGQRGAQLISQILDFTRQSVLSKQKLDMTYYLPELVRLLQRTIPENIHIHLNIDSSQNNYNLYGDPTQLQQAITNLAINARDAMPHGGHLNIDLSALTLTETQSPPHPDLFPGYWLTLSVSDSGSGIHPHDLPHIYEPFFTTKEVGQGTGLGLAQVYGIIKQHGGLIDVASQLDQGTRFTLYLPVTTEPMTESAPHNVNLPSGNNQVVLLVEDEPTVLEVTESMLKYLGYQVLCAADGEEALTIYQRRSHDVAVVVTDMTMPNMGGLALTQNLVEQNPAIKVIITSGYKLEADEANPLQPGIVCQLSKPIKLETLAQTLHRVLNSPAEMRSSVAEHSQRGLETKI